MVEEEPPIQIKVEQMQVDDVEATDPQDRILGTDTTVEISPPEFSSIPRIVSSCLSQPPLLQLEIYRSLSYHTQSFKPSEMESFVEKDSHATSP